MKKKATAIKEVERMKRIRAEIPSKLYEQMDRLVREGWFRSQEDIINDALRRYLNFYRPERLEKNILDDVERALGGKS